MIYAVDMEGLDGIGNLLAFGGGDTIVVTSPSRSAYTQMESPWPEADVDEVTFTQLEATAVLVSGRTIGTAESGGRSSGAGNQPQPGVEFVSWKKRTFRSSKCVWIATGVVLLLGLLLVATCRSMSPSSKAESSVASLALAAGRGPSNGLRDTRKTGGAEPGLVQVKSSPDIRTLESKTGAARNASTARTAREWTFPGTYPKNRYLYDTLHPDKLASILAQLRTCEGTILVKGHSCSLGETHYNLRLSQKRADGVRNLLIDKGPFDPSRIMTVGMGDKEPLKQNRTEIDRIYNRRVTITCVMGSPDRLPHRGRVR